ncbi:helix-turn-helix domain-containing protein [Terriglobus aquaticus]|uniref:Helix-turn-helix domain-containing protein n=1 Tax=Terriglobus aquaticus TaxID=940139 RepID=A0ABW9KPR8_9BACT
MELKSQELELAVRLKQARLKAGLTQNQLARRMGRPQSFISKTETAERSPAFLEVVVLADLLGISIGDLIPRTLRKED